MDAADARILRELGMEPFLAWPRRKAGLRLADVARTLGRNLQFVKDRVQRMEAEGVITGYRVFPNLRHFGLDYTVYHCPVDFVPDSEQGVRLASVDGFVGVVWYLESGFCINLCHGSPGERERRLTLVTELIDAPRRPVTLYHRAFPHVPRTLSPLDWRIIHALQDHARRPLAEVADALGVTAKTVRSHFNAMWKEGSIDTHVQLEFSRVSGIIPFQMAVWYEAGAGGVDAALLNRLKDVYLDHFNPPEGTYAPFLIRVFARTAAEVQALVREALAVEGVRTAEAQLATGSFWSDEWVADLVARRAKAAGPGLP